MGANKVRTKMKTCSVFTALLIAGIGASAQSQTPPQCPGMLVPTTLDVLAQSVPCNIGYGVVGAVFKVSRVTSWQSKGFPIAGGGVIHMADISVSIGANSSTSVNLDLTSPLFAVDIGHSAAFGFAILATGRYLNPALSTYHVIACPALGLVTATATFGSGAGAGNAMNLLDGLVLVDSQATASDVTGEQWTQFRAAFDGFGCKLAPATFRINLSQ